MRLKRVLLLVILIAGYTWIMVNYPNDKIKAFGYNQFMNIYADLIASRAEYKVVHDPGLRKLPIPKEQVKIRAIIPQKGLDFPREINQLIDEGYNAVIECSAMDAWHTSERGIEYLSLLRPTAYRLVVFDGGHHLPTIGLKPDIIIVPQMMGFALHSYTNDGIKVEKLVSIARQVDSPSIIITVPRWAVIKNERALTHLAARILATVEYRAEGPREEFQVAAFSRMSRYEDSIFAYLNQGYIENLELFVKRIEKLAAEGASLYIAVDYDVINQEEAERLAVNLRQRLGLPVSIVNRPVTVFNVLWSDY